jgi:hypothetical protein
MCRKFGCYKESIQNIDIKLKGRSFNGMKKEVEILLKISIVRILALSHKYTPEVL